jgi:hypothetical protein
MVQFQVEIKEAIVRSMGRAEVEKYLREYVMKLHLKQAAKEILKDLKANDLTNDPQWQTARNLAWQQEKHNYLAPLA